MENQKLRKSNRVCESALAFLVLLILSRNYKTRRLLLLPRMYSYICSFTLKLTATLLQKLATFYMSDVRQNNEMMEGTRTLSTVVMMIM